MGLFSGKSEHPLANAKAARELFDRLNNEDPIDAIEEIETWLESTAGDVQIKPQRQVEVLFQLNDMGDIAASKLARDYLQETGNNSQSLKVWLANRKYWRQLAASFRLVLDHFETDKKLLEQMHGTFPQIFVRLLRAYGGCLKWDQFRYGPVDPDIWQGAGRVYIQAQKNYWLDKKQNLDKKIQTTIAAEYMRLLLFQAASMDRLPPLEIDLAERLLAYFLPAFSLTAKVSQDNVYWVDVAKSLPPTRLIKLPEITTTLRFFATAGGLAAIETMRNQIESSHSIPRELELKQQFPESSVVKVLKHLSAFCAPLPPMRSHVRHQVSSSVRLVDRFEFACAALRGDIVAGVDCDVEDVSQGGMRAQLELSGHNGPAIGALVAMCPEGGDNWLIGIVRRINRQSDNRGSIGIETIGRSPATVNFDSSGIDGEGLLLEPLPDGGTATLMVVSQSVWQDFRPVNFIQNSDRYTLRPLEELQRGSDFVIGRYWVDRFTN